MKKLLILTIFLSIVSCNEHENEAKDLVKKANVFFYDYHQNQVMYAF